MSRKLKGGGPNPVWIFNSDMEEVDAANPFPVTGVITGGDVTIDNPATNPVLIAPFSPILQSGLIELIGVDEQVDQFEYSGSVAFALGSVRSGEILYVSLYADEIGTGQIITEGGTLLILDADPAVAVGDANLTNAEWPTVIGSIRIDASDWFEENAGAQGSLCSFDIVPFVPVTFHELATLYFVYYHSGATSWNDAGGDDERLRFRFWYRRES